jgi:hypothetical protein
MSDSKNFPRKDAKTQRRSQMPFRSFASLRLCVAGFSIFLMTVSIPSAFSQKSKTPPFDPDGSFWLHGPPPTDFSDFGGINLNAKRSRHLPDAGLDTNNGKHYRYKTLSVKRHSFTFTTIAMRGVSYSFSGRFLKGGIYQSGILDDETPVLEGTLTKYRAGKKVAEAKMKFVYFGGT